ncbi:MAG: hypothetical protein OZ921_07310 [Sorangiineae bacterium]|nr:hypothetical protein [Polyangiaceae bacterium]MEB2322304.1 hypothetical protein [Sorangiineae bacterium]
MGIDGIGKPGGGPLGTGGVASPGGGTPIQGESFRVDQTSAAGPPTGSEELGRLERGEIGLDQYLDARVTGAVEHLQGELPAEQLEFVRESLREQLATDPVLVELVRRATGSTPTRTP